MKISNEKVKIQATGQEYEFEMPLPETLEEAGEVFGLDEVYGIFIAGLKVKLQNIARESFRAEVGVDEVNEKVAAYRPGTISRRSVKAQAMDLLVNCSEVLKADPELRMSVMEPFIKGDFKSAVAILQEIEG